MAQKTAGRRATNLDVIPEPFFDAIGNGYRVQLLDRMTGNALHTTGCRPRVEQAEALAWDWLRGHTGHGHSDE